MTEREISIGRRSVFTALIAGFCLLAGANAPAAEAAASEKPAIDVLLLGYYIWAKPEYIELCQKAGIHIHLAKREDPTAADPADYPLEYLKKFHVIVVSGPMEKPWDPQMVHGGVKAGIVDNLLADNKLGGGLVWTPRRWMNPWTARPTRPRSRSPRACAAGYATSGRPRSSRIPSRTAYGGCSWESLASGAGRRRSR